MKTAGCDIGSRTAKAVIFENNTIVSSAVIPAKLDPVESSETVIQMALDQAKLKMENIDTIVGTGYGQQEIPFAHRLESEIVCHAKGAWWNIPSARMIIDIGGQDSKAIKIDQNGRVIRYTYNDKCASGTGRFLEIMADALHVELNEMGKIGKTFKEKLNISNQCVIFAETEVVSLINEEKEVADILNALHISLANRVASLARSLTIEQDIIMTGGVAKNIGVFDALSDGIGFPVKGLDGIDPQINGALGAAIIASEG
ncbi:MAG: CoA-substrate-specific enzyme activase [Candidatus Magnetoglobus multicellularis str. Araruama]|uniref:CoA-substrate-specific enzyme activase n=1 Tax=Candidatus Magnetoglobus multicellularis str. Araruama TaxID=890399 RepID=A0A1V1PED8_9BACT|nr:MAG: CoA-substrate-specific enzyme activase [Candidatus Magnetoglobus multicellularis str. Araruama]